MSLRVSAKGPVMHRNRPSQVKHPSRSCVAHALECPRALACPTPSSGSTSRAIQFPCRPMCPPRRESHWPLRRAVRHRHGTFDRERSSTPSYLRCEYRRGEQIVTLAQKAPALDRKRAAHGGCHEVRPWWRMAHRFESTGTHAGERAPVAGPTRSRRVLGRTPGQTGPYGAAVVMSTELPVSEPEVAFRVILPAVVVA